MHAVRLPISSPRKVPIVSRSSSYIILWFVCALIGVASGCSQFPARTAAASSPSRTCNLPRNEIQVAFATDRDAKELPDGRVEFGTGRSNIIHFGTVIVPFPPIRAIGSLPIGAKLEITSDTSSSEAISKVLATRDGTDDPKSASILIFVHGFGEDFGSSILRAAQVVHDGCFDVVPLLFSWPTTHSITDYAYDRDSAIYARDDLARVILGVTKRNPNYHLFLFAHSMGNWVALEALRVIASDHGGTAKPKFDAIVLASPDVDVDVFRRNILFPQSLSSKTVVVSNQRDITLRLSGFFAGNVPRAGAATEVQFTNHGVLKSERFEILSVDDLCGPLIHRCTEKTERGLMKLSAFFPTGWR